METKFPGTGVLTLGGKTVAGLQNFEYDGEVVHATLSAPEFVGAGETANLKISVLTVNGFSLLLAGRRLSRRRKRLLRAVADQLAKSLLKLD